MRRCIRRRNFRDDLANEGIAKGVRALLTLPVRLWGRAPALPLAPLTAGAVAAARMRRSPCLPAVERLLD
jgi:hypothetical protein